METMQAVVKTEAGKGAVYIEKPIPEISDLEVLVKVRTTSICGSDLHLYNWETWSEDRIHLPRVMGHEMAGEVVEVGKMVKNIQAGDYISAETHLYCGRCYACLQGRQEVCLNLKILGFDQDGSFANYVCLPENVIWKNDPLIPKDWGSLQEPLGNAIDTVLAENVTGKTDLFTGCGPIRLLGIGVAKAAGASEIFATDINDYRLELALKMGATQIMNPGKVDVIEIIMDSTRGAGVEILIEMSGNAKAFAQGLEALTPGGFASLLGLYREKKVPVDLNRQIILKGIRLVGITGRKIFATWNKTTQLLKSGQLNLDPVITHKFPLSDFEKGIHLMEKGTCGKIVLYPPD